MTQSLPKENWKIPSFHADSLHPNADVFQRPKLKISGKECSSTRMTSYASHRIGRFRFITIKLKGIYAWRSSFKKSPVGFVQRQEASILVVSEVISRVPTSKDTQCLVRFIRRHARFHCSPMIPNNHYSSVKVQLSSSSEGLLRLPL